MQGLAGRTHKMNGKYHEMNSKHHEMNGKHHEMNGQISQYDLHSIIRHRRRYLVSMKNCILFFKFTIVSVPEKKSEKNHKPIK